MALVLNLETATTVCSVALAKDGILLALKEVNGDYSHGENLTVFAEEVLSTAGYAFNQLDAIAVSKGPGSYTGLRIGVSSAKGYCYALDKPLIAINTLQSMARYQALQLKNEQPYSNALYCPMIDARRMEVYCALYDANNKEVESTKAVIVDEHSFKEYLQKQPLIFFGDGAAKCKTILSQHQHAVFLDNIFPSAQNMCQLAEEKFKSKAFEDLAYFEPFYLKDFVAGVKKTA